MVAAGIRSRVLRERKLRELLPNASGIRRLPPYYSVDPSSVPNSDEGRAYTSYCNLIHKQSIVVFLIGAAGLAIAYFIPVAIKMT
jgi:hypothetical protein